MDWSPPDETSPPVVGQGRYRCDRKLGVGGSAAVWLATDHVLRRAVAVKILHDDSPHVRSRFLREARLIAAIQHINVVRVLDFGAFDGEPAFMVMEFLQGQGLAERMEQRGVNAEESLVLMAGILDGLEAVHRTGIIHKDLKPENVLVAEGDEGSFPILIDFGISHAERGELSSAITTHEGLVRGTPHYMPPEQARALEIDARADVYAAGVVFYEMLSGALPHQGETAADVMIQVASQPAIPLETRVPTLPQTVLDVVARAMARNADDRFATAAEMREALADAALEWPDAVDVWPALQKRPTTDSGLRSPSRVTPMSTSAVRRRAHSVHSAATLDAAEPMAEDPADEMALPRARNLGVVAGLVALLGVAAVGLAVATGVFSSSAPDGLVTPPPGGDELLRTDSPVEQLPPPAPPETQQTDVPSAPPVVVPAEPTRPATEPRVRRRIRPTAPRRPVRPDVTSDGSGAEEESSARSPNPGAATAPASPSPRHVIRNPGF